MKIIAKKSDMKVLEYIDKDYGRVIDFENNYIGPKNLIFSILARGYWNEYPEPIEFTPPINMDEMKVIKENKNEK